MLYSTFVLIAIHFGQRMHELSVPLVHESFDASLIDAEILDAEARRRLHLECHLSAVTVLCMGAS